MNMFAAYNINIIIVIDYYFVFYMATSFGKTIRHKKQTSIRDN